MAAPVIEKKKQQEGERQSLQAEKDSMQQKCRIICETVGAMANSWPAIVATDLPSLVADLRLMMHISLSAMPACALMRSLINLYVPVDRVPNKRELADCLYKISGPHYDVRKLPGKSLPHIRTLSHQHNCILHTDMTMLSHAL